MLFIDAAPVPNQILSTTLGGQNCQIKIYYKSTGNLFIDLYVNNALVIGGVVALNATLIVRDEYLGFIGDLCFFDMQSAGIPQDPVYTEIGTRFLLAYIEASELSY
jgi:hypothetical protein